MSLKPPPQPPSASLRTGSPWQGEGEGGGAVIPFVRGFFPQAPAISGLVTTPSVSDWLAIGGVLAAAAGLLESAGVWFFRQLGGLYRRLRDQFVAFYVRRRAVVGGAEPAWV